MAKAYKNYQQLSDDLEAVLSQLQDSEVSVDEALKLHERGLKIVDELESYLKMAQNKVVKVTKSEGKT